MLSYKKTVLKEIQSYTELRTAAIQREKEIEKEKERRERDVIALFDEGFDAYQASHILDIPLSEVARIEKYNQERRRFLATGRFPDMHSGSFSLMNGIPTPR
jgi:hypothetical protein